MELFEILKTKHQSIKQCFKLGGLVKTVKNHKTNIAGNGQSHIPEEIIQRIQYFLNGKEAAQTTLLSKFWRSAWSTRPNLDFDELHFQQSNEVQNLQTVQQLLEYAKKTMQRYEDLKLNIETFRLHTYNYLFFKEERESHYLSLANELIVKAMKLGAFDLDITLRNQYFVLPDSVLRSETLARLSLCGPFTIDFKHLTYSKIKSLSLSHVDVDVEGLSDSDEFPNLEYMYLCFICTKGSLLNDASFISRFSSLNELVFVNCLKGNIQICSKSVERITLITSSSSYELVSAKFDVPNIRRFKFDGLPWPDLALKTTRRDWESDIRLDCFCPNDVDWFIDLSKLLTELSMSRVSLSIYVFGNKLIDWCGGSLSGAADLPTTPRVVKKLTLGGPGLNTSFLDNLFFVCRPKLIFRKYSSFFRSDLIEKYLLKLVCEGILEQVNVEVLEMAWRSVPLYHHHANANANANSTRFYKAQAQHLKKIRFKTRRFQLRWAMEPSEPK